VAPAGCPGGRARLLTGTTWAAVGGGQESGETGPWYAARCCTAIKTVRKSSGNRRIPRA